MDQEVLKVEELCIHIHSEDRDYPVVEHVSFEVLPEHTLCIVGESGCGKTMTALSIMGLLPPNASASGKVIFKGQNLLELEKEQIRRIRGKEISMVFQDPLTSLNPVLTIFEQIREIFEAHDPIPSHLLENRVVEVLQEVSIPDAQHKVHAYPHQLSGGMRQRVLIGMALALGPTLVIADEPTTALDVTIQAEILELFNCLKKEKGLSAIYITHDLSVVSEVGDEILIMYAGMVVEKGPKYQILTDPAHPYTQGLLKSSPSYEKRGRPLPFIPGNVPSPEEKGKGCPFYPRCELSKRECEISLPPITSLGPGHVVRCWEIRR